MAISRVQATPASSSTGGNLSLTFGASPGAGNLIVVPVIMYSNGGALGVSVADNQGNTYHVGASAPGSNGSQSKIYYAYNIAASGGTFTVTVTRTGNAAQQTEAIAIEFFGLGTVDPVVGSGTGVATGSFPLTVSTGVTSAPEVAVVACVAAFRLNFNVTGITINVLVPPYVQEYEKLSSSPFVMVGEADSRVVSSGAAQTAAWSFTGTPAGGSMSIVAFYSTPPPAFARVTQLAREVLEIESPVSARLTQMARQVLYPFTCVPGATEIRMTQLPVEVAYDYQALQPFVKGSGVDWITPKR